MGHSVQMNGEQLVEVIERLLETDVDIDFLSKLSKSELETLVVVMRNRVEKFEES